MATHSSVLAWRIPGTGEPGGLPSLGLHRVRYDWSDLTVAVAKIENCFLVLKSKCILDPLGIKPMNLVVLFAFGNSTIIIVNTSC